MERELTRAPQAGRSTSSRASSEGSRLCMLLETYHPEIGGGESQARLLAEGLVERGFRVSVLTRRSMRHLPSFETVGGVSVRRVGPAGPGRLRKWGLLLTVPPELVGRRRSYDVLLVSGLRILGLPAVLTGRLLGKPCILKADSNGEVSGSYFASGLGRWGLSPSAPPIRAIIGLRNAVLRRADLFVPLSTEIATELRAGGIPEGRMVTIPNGVDTDRFQPVDEATKRGIRVDLGLPPDQPVAVFTGRLVRYKGLPLLLRAWGEVLRRNPRARLLLVGAGGADLHNCEDELRRYVEAHGMQESVLFTGFVEKVEPYLQAADLFVFPTQDEAFGISLVEAMACGLPVVTTWIGGIRDIVTPNQDALVVEPGEMEPLAAAIHRLLSDRMLAARLGAQARRTVTGRFSRGMVVSQYERLIRDCAIKTRSDGPG